MGYNRKKLNRFILMAMMGYLINFYISKLYILIFNNQFLIIMLALPSIHQNIMIITHMVYLNFEILLHLLNLNMLFPLLFMQSVKFLMHHF